MAYNFSLYNVIVSGCKHVRKHVLPFTYPVSTMSTESANKVVERVTRDFRKIGIFEYNLPSWLEITQITHSKHKNC